MASELQPRYLEYLKSDVYPRVEFFQRMLSSLLPRFVRITNIMDELYVDKQRVTEIQSFCKQLLGHPKIFHINPEKEFDLSRTVALKKYFISRIYNELDWNGIAEDTCLLTAVVYYYKGTENQVSSDCFTDDLKKHVNRFLSDKWRESAQTSHGAIKPVTGPLSSLFIICDIDSLHREEENYSQIKESILSSIKSVKDLDQTDKPVGQIDIHRQLDMSEILQLSGISNARYRLNVGKHVDIGCDVSTFLEDRVLLGFDVIDNFLMDFRKIDPSCFRVSKSAMEDNRIVISIKGLFCNLDLLIITMQDQCVLIENNQASTLDLKNIYYTLIKVISFSIKSVVIQILWEKYGLCQILIHKCLMKVDFQREVEKSLNTNNSLRESFGKFFSKIYPDISDKTDNDNGTSKLVQSEVTKTSSVQEDIETLTTDIVSCLKNSVRKMEEEVVKVNKFIELVKKMNFEIAGYYKRTKLRDQRNKPSLPFSKDLQSEILSLNDVIGCGFIYSVFEILVKEQSEDEYIENTIQDIVNKYKYLGQYTIKRVKVGRSGELGFTHHGLYIKG